MFSASPGVKPMACVAKALITTMAVLTGSL